MTDITENLIHTSDAVSSPSSSSSDEVEHLHPLQQNVPQKMTPPGRLDGKLKNHELVHIPPTKNDKCQHKNVVCVYVCVRKNINKETRFLCAQCGVPLHPEGCYT